MVPITANTPILLAVKPVDFRRQIDGLVAHCQQVLKADPCCGALFVFINKARTMIRVLVYDHNGYWIMTKRLSRVSFQGWPTNRQPLSTLAAGALMRLLRGDNGDHTPEKEPVNPIAQNVEKFRTESTKLPTRSTPFTRELNNVC